jgi:hypothetical protein
MAEGNVSGPPLPTVKTNKPVSEALLNEKVCRPGFRFNMGAVQLLWYKDIETCTLRQPVAACLKHTCHNWILKRAQIFEALLTRVCCSGIAQSLPSSYDLHSGSPSASYSQCYYSSEEHGLYGWEQGLEQAELGRRPMVRFQRKRDVMQCSNKACSQFQAW